ncbi:hypothetical protein [Flavobacterium sp. AED]|uniref:hypothetical protein n=1 Tax=Flavobacterium sp. AED TaxID=1423323 RepID=UPI00057EBFDA|nr:hypothetical protein [Flavobacterium sp. AED]KIA86138.1 hypothetical protein OA85_00135 [Flavobacterium sp. AED]
MIGFESQLSLTVGIPKTGVAPHATVSPAGQVSVGGVTSWTLIVCVAEEWLPQSSVAVQVLVTL